MAAPPAREELSDNYPAPSNGVMRIGMGKFYDYVRGLLGATGDATEARLALGVPAKDNAELTGNPTATTQPAGTYNTRLATTEFADRVVNGYLLLSAAGAGTLALDAEQSGVGLLRFSGALTGARTVTVPAKSGSWIVSNATSGAYSFTLKTPAGTGIVISQGSAKTVFCDGVNIYELSILPAQVGQAGKALVTNGTNEAWGYPDHLATVNGSAPSYAARAHINFNGQGTPAIRSSGNISSITDNGLADFTLNFAAALPANYAAVFGGTYNMASARDQNIGIRSTTPPTSSQLRIAAHEPNTGLVDPLYVNVAIFG